MQGANNNPLGTPLQISNEGTEPRSTRKRRFFVDDDGCPFLDDHKSAAAAKSRASFLDFHFDVLQSLYKKNGDGGIETAAAVDVNVWKMIQSFIQQREQLLFSKHEAACMQGIHSEAVRHQVADDAGSPTSGDGNNNTVTQQQQSSPGSPHMRNNNVTRLNHEKPSPAYALKNNSKYLSQASASSSPPMLNDATLSSSSSSNHFHVVARLLGRRRKIVESSFQQQADPFQPLLQATGARIASLQQELHELQQSVRRQDQKRIHDLVSANIYKSRPNKALVKDAGSEEQLSAERSRMAEMECKIRLWSLLAEDLRAAISAPAVVAP